MCVCVCVYLYTIESKFHASVITDPLYFMGRNSHMNYIHEDLYFMGFFANNGSREMENQ